ncbi:MAG: hypothetical protein E7307_00100 [Butyrivibrio sp.]|nr:hypothetical protein [Butyrivibrio sp.]
MRNKVISKILCSVLTLTMSFTSTGMVSFAGEEEASLEITGQAESEEKEEAAAEKSTYSSEQPSADGSSTEEVLPEDASYSNTGEYSEFPEETDTELQEESSSTTIEGSSDADSSPTIPAIVFPEGFEGMVDDEPSFEDYSEGNPPLYGASDDDVYVDITGTYYTLPADTILNQLNKIRKEAFDEGLATSYVPLKWSAKIEASARKRAMEAGITMYHNNLYGGSIYEYIGYKSPFYSVAEDLAWNNNHNSSGITYGINQFYEEKSEYLKELRGESHGVTGHYTSIINPKYEYVGVAGCQMSCTPNGWFTVALQLGGNPITDDIDETKDNSTGKTTQTLRVSPGYISSANLSGPDEVAKGATATYNLTGKISYPSRYGNITPAYVAPGGEGRGFEWTTSDNSIAAVEDGVVTGIKGGKVNIQSNIASKTASKEITVTVPLDGLSLTCSAIADGILNDNTYELIRDEVKTGTISVEYLPDDATDKKAVTWKSSNTKVATVNSSGAFTLLKAGQTVITATAKTSNAAKPTVTASITLNVKVPITDIKLNKESATLNYTGTKPPTLQLSTSIVPADAEGSIDVVYTSSDPNVATVNDKGLVTAVSGGTATITATAGSFSKTCEVEVNAPVKAIATEAAEKRLFTTENSSQLTATLTPLYTSDKGVTFASSDTSVFTVSEGTKTGSGEVTITGKSGVATVTLNRVAAENGEATLSVSTENGKFRKDVKVVIAKPTEDFTIHAEGDEEDLSGKELNKMQLGASTKYICDVFPADAYDNSIIWESSNPTVARITAIDESSSLVSYIGKGTATITCTNNNAPTPIVKSFEVTTGIYADAISLSRDTLELYEDESYGLTAAILPEGTEEGAVVSFTSDNTDVATVDNSGNVTAIAAGTAVITASSDGLTSADCTVTVYASDVVLGDTPFEDENIDGIWLARQSFDTEIEYTGAKITQPGIRLYYGKRLLKEKTDYTVSYRYNINAAPADSSKAPQMTVTLKGNLQGKKTYYFAITPVDINGSKVTESGQLTVTYNKKAQKPVPELYFKGKKLVNKKDFTCEYNDEAEKYTGPSGDDLPVITIKGKGNFAGVRTGTFRIVEASQSLGKASVTIGPSDTSSKKIFFKGSLTPEDLKIVVKLGGKEIAPAYYEITSDLPDKPGKAAVTIAATEEGHKNNVFGYKTVNITTYADRSIKDASIIGFTDSMVFDHVKATTGGGMEQEISLKWDDEVLTEDTDYKLTYSGNTKVGTARMTVTGLGRYAGSLSKSFKIIPCTLDITEEHPEEMSFTKGGAKPNVTVTYGKNTASEYVLSSKTDYSVVILDKSDRKPGIMQFRIVGKGAFKGYKSETLSISVTPGDLKKATMVLTDKAAVSKGSGWKSSVKLLDTNGKALTSGKDYEKNLIFAYEGMTTAPVPAARTTVYVTAIGKGDYAGSSITRSYRVFEKAISKLTFVVDPEKVITYTGRSIEPQAGVNVHAYPSARNAKAGTGEIAPADNYMIIGYTANVNSGTGKITVRGLGTYGGTKVLTFKIKKKSY